MDLKKIKVTWMDNVEETYEDVTTSVHEGVLHVHQYVGSARMLRNEWHFPISNIRVWSPLTNGSHHAET